MILFLVTFTTVLPTLCVFAFCLYLMLLHLSRSPRPCRFQHLFLKNYWFYFTNTSLETLKACLSMLLVNHFYLWPDFSPNLQDKIQNGKPRFKAATQLLYKVAISQREQCHYCQKVKQESRHKEKSNISTRKEKKGVNECREKVNAT